MINDYRAIIICIGAVLLAGCGLATSDAERLQRADEQIASGAYRAATIELKNVLANDPDNIYARLRLAEVSLGLGDLSAAQKEMTRAAELGASESQIKPLSLQILAERNDFSEMLAALSMETDALAVGQQLKFRGQALLGLGNADTAQSTYREWLELEPQSVDAAVGLAMSIAAGGNADGAISQLKDLADQHPQHVDARVALASLYFRSADYDKARTAFESALANSILQANVNRHIRILAGLSESQLALGNLEEARRNITRLSSIAPQSPVTLFLSARLARMDRDYALAARHLQLLLNLSPDNTQAQLFLANVQMMQGNFAQAESLLNRVVVQAPDNLQARKLLAQVQLKQSQPQGAVEALAPFLNDVPDDASIYNLLAEVGLQQGDAQSVIENLRTASELAPDDVDAKVNLAGAYLNTGETRVAMEVLQAVPAGSKTNYRREQLVMMVLEAENRVDEARVVAETLLSDHGVDSSAVKVAAGHFLRSDDMDRARSILSEFLDRMPDDIGVSIALARIELAGGNTSAASELFRAVQKADATNLVASLGIARVEELTGDPDAVIGILETAAADHPSGLAPRVWLAIHYLDNDRLDDAEKMANELIGIGFRNAKISNVVGGVFLETGRLDEAVAQFETAARLEPDSTSTQFNLARAYLALNRTVDARLSLNRALELTPGWIPAKTTLALVELRQGRTEEALRLVAELRAENPGRAAVMVLEGEVLLHQKDYTGAARAYERAVNAGAGMRAVLREHQARIDGQLSRPESPLVDWLERNPDDGITRRMLAQYYLQTNAGDAAIREYEIILQQEPDDAAVLNNLAWQHQQLGELDQAVDIAERAFALESDSGAIADTLGWIYRDMGELDKSLERLKDATRLSPAEGEIKYHLAIVMSETGNTDEARQVLEALIESDDQFPSRKEATDLLRQLN